MARPRVLVMSGQIQAFAKVPEADYDLSILSDYEDRDGWLEANGAGIAAVVAGGMERLDAARLDLMPDLRLISVIAAGMSGIDLAAARARGIHVTNAGDNNAGDVADMAVAMMLAVSRDLMACDAYVRAGHWPIRRMAPHRSVADQRVGIIGLGHIGQAVASRLTPFGCAIRWWGPNPKPDVPWPRESDLHELARWASVLILCVAGKEDTRGLVDARILDALGPCGLIVNVSRGFVIDEPAMLDRLRTGRLGAAALDVFDHEPIDGNDWKDLPNVLLAPHMAGATEEAFEAIAANARDNVCRLFAGEALRNEVI